MSHVVNSFDYKGYNIKVMHDEDAMNPRTEWDNLGAMVCFHNRYNLGDKDHGFGSPDELLDHIKENKSIALMLYLYDHSGISMNCSGFSHCDSAGWDWGRVGMIFIDRDKVREEYGWKRITKEREAKIVEYLTNEVKTYDDFLTGSVYGYQIEKDGEELDSCWGFYGYDNKESGLLDESESTIRYYITEAKKEMEAERQRQHKRLKQHIRNRVPLKYREPFYLEMA